MSANGSCDGFGMTRKDFRHANRKHRQTGANLRVPDCSFTNGCQIGDSLRKVGFFQLSLRCGREVAGQDVASIARSWSD